MATREKTRQPGVYRRGSSYQITYTDSTGKQRWETIRGSFDDAVERRNSLISRMYRGEVVAPSKIKLNELLDEWFDNHSSHLRPTTLRQYEDSANFWVRPKMGHMIVSKIHKRHVVTFIGDMRREGKASSTIKNALKPLSQAMEWAVDEGWVAQNPVKLVPRRQMPSGGGEKMMRILDQNEINLMLTNAEEKWRPLLLTAVFTGLRQQELYRLRWDDIDLIKGEMIVTTSKTKAGVRTVVLPNFVVRELAALSPDQPPFLYGGGVPRTWASTARRKLRDSLERAGIITYDDDGKPLDRVRFHDLRHTFASILISQGHDPTYVRDQMGHANVAVTFATYAHLFDPVSRREEGRRRMEEQFGNLAASAS